MYYLCFLSSLETLEENFLNLIEQAEGSHHVVHRIEPAVSISSQNAQRKGSVSVQVMAE